MCLGTQVGRIGTPCWGFCTPAEVCCAQCFGKGGLQLMRLALFTLLLLLLPRAAHYQLLPLLLPSAVAAAWCHHHLRRRCRPYMHRPCASTSLQRLMQWTRTTPRTLAMWGTCTALLSQAHSRRPQPLEVRSVCALRVLVSSRLRLQCCCHHVIVSVCLSLSAWQGMLCWDGAQKTCDAILLSDT